MKILNYSIALLFMVTLWGCSQGNSSAPVTIDPTTNRHPDGWALNGTGGTHPAALPRLQPFPAVEDFPEIPAARLFPALLLSVPRPASDQEPGIAVRAPGEGRPVPAGLWGTQEPESAVSLRLR